ncbi:MAG TPA: phospholipase D family protein [Eoetvoesiella sp.]
MRAELIKQAFAQATAARNKATGRHSFCTVMACACLMMSLTGCAQLPSLDGRSTSVTLLDTANTRLGKAVMPAVRAHPGKSGVIALTDGSDAFAARVLLTDAAQRTLDVQNYIWHDDISGTLLFESLHRAADRGVRVRLLLDDNNTKGLDSTLAALDAHPNIQVRLFNPFMQRQWRLLGNLADFSRLNRRMHNKSFTADNQASIVGGRNIGDEYFDAGQDLAFVDLDVLAIGAVVSDVSRDFDRYWASASSYPADRVLPAVTPASISNLVASAAKAQKQAGAKEYMEAVARQSFLRDLLAGTLQFGWASTRMVSDDPAKGLGNAPKAALLPQRLNQILGTPRHDLYLVSSYFVPTKQGVRYLAALSRQGVKITVLTNSLEATDVVAVHAGYAKWRKELLKAGVALFEMKGDPIDSPEPRRRLIGRSSASLHAKTFAVDRSRVFIGSFNFDPRSARLNTEMGFVVDSPVLAQAIFDAFGGHIPDHSYQVKLGKDDMLQWIERKDGKIIVHKIEPGTTALLRFGVDLMSLLPLDWML